MKALLTEMKKRLEAGEDTVLVTVVASSGATPRAAGARMLVGRDGRICGTIGGGMVEHRAEELAKEAVSTRTSQLKEYSLQRNQVENLGMICGGNVTLYFRFLAGRDEKLIQLCANALEQFSEHKTTWLITELTDRTDGQIGLYSEKLGLMGIEDLNIVRNISGVICSFECGGRHWYAEQLLRAGFVYVFGGGHVAQELVPVLAHLDFRCIVMEDRPEFATSELFQTAEKIKLVDLEHIEDMKSITADDYIVIMTRGHRYDQIIQEQALRTPAKYIGVIGSAHKKAAVMKSIMEHGFSQSDVDRITAPIGIMSIKAETPAEIAISIAGQLIALRAGAGVVS